jgi:hypothetical protein
MLLVSSSLVVPDTEEATDSNPVPAGGGAHLGDGVTGHMRCATVAEADKCKAIPGWTHAVGMITYADR